MPGEKLEDGHSKCIQVYAGDLLWKLDQMVRLRLFVVMWAVQSSLCKCGFKKVHCSDKQK